MHFWDHSTPIEEVMSTLNSLIVEGKVHYLGVSDTPSWIVAQANTIATMRGWAPFVVYQGQYSLRMRDMDHDVHPMCSALGLGSVPWGVIGGGMLTGKHKPGESAAADTKRKVRDVTDKDWEIIDEMQKVQASMKGETPSLSQIAINWVMSHAVVTSALIGCRTLAQLEDNLCALNFSLEASQITALNEISAIKPIFPHSMIGHSNIELRSKPWYGAADAIIDL